MLLLLLKVESRLDPGLGLCRALGHATACNDDYV